MLRIFYVVLGKIKLFFEADLELSGCLPLKGLCCAL